MRLLTYCFWSILVVAVTLPVQVVGCGFDYATQVLVEGDRSLLSTPKVDFYNRLDSFLECIDEPLVSKGITDSNEQGELSYQEFTDKVDRDEFARTVNKMHLSNDESLTLLLDYAEVRGGLFSDEQSDSLDNNGEEMLIWARENFELGPGELREYYGYLLGAIYYHLDEPDEAFLAWKMVLMLPEHLRKKRSVWASYMLGRITQEDNPEEALRYYNQVISLVDSGYEDSLGLVKNTYGWQAKSLWQLNRVTEAILLYLQIGDKGSIQYICKELIGEGYQDVDEVVLQKLIAEPKTRRTISLYLLSEGSLINHNFAKQWFNTLVVLEPSSPEEAEDIAWFSYKMGDYELAEKWLMQSADTILTKRLWIKIHLINGDIDSAVNGLAKLIQEISPEVRQQLASQVGGDGGILDIKRVQNVLLGDIGTLYLSRGLFVEALDYLYKGGHWADAAYVAERVLSIKELVGYVNRLPKPRPDNIRHLLARRLAREHYFESAKWYFPDGFQKDFIRYQQLFTTANNQNLAEPVRAKAMVEMGHLIASQGSELIATEVEPDWYIYNCDFEQGSTPAARATVQSGTISGMSEEELSRLNKNMSNTPDERFHYEYVAAEYMWDASLLMADGTEQLANILCEAGSWLKNNDPEAADKFYKSLVSRAGETSLGQLASVRRWFPVCM